MTQKTIIDITKAWLPAAFLILWPVLAQAQQSQLLWLHTSGTNIVDSNGKVVVLRGVNLGGAFEVTPWISALKLSSPPSGFPEIQDEVTLWSVLQQRFGTSQMQQLQQTWRTSWLTPADVANVAALGGNAVRIPLFYQMLQSDSNPDQLIPGGLAILDAIVAACAQYGVYAILDLHGAPGGQSNAFTTGQIDSDELWSSPAYQQQTIEFWTLLAAHYQNHPEVAGYDLINEPIGATVPELIDLHNRIYQGVRSVDQNHIIIMEDGYKGPSAFPVPSSMGWSNICYSIHIYHLDALSDDPFEEDITTNFAADVQTQQGIGTPLYIGEFSTETNLLSRADAMSVLPAYLGALDSTGWSWTPWTYKVFYPMTGTVNIWGVYTNDTPWNEANPYTDSFGTLQQKFANYVTSNTTIQSDFSAALSAGLKGQIAAAPTITGIVNGASFLVGTAAATWTTIFGTNLSSTTTTWQPSDFNGNLLPTTLGGVSVTIDGLPAYVYYVSPSQIDFLAPDDSALGTVAVQVMNSGGTASGMVEKSGFSPAFFTFAGNYVAAVHANGTLVGPSTPATPGETIEMYGTGFGPTNPPTPSDQIVSPPFNTVANPVTVSVGGVTCQTTFEGLVGSGLYQFNVVIPSNAASGSAPVIASVQGEPTPTVEISIQ